MACILCNNRARSRQPGTPVDPAQPAQDWFNSETGWDDIRTMGDLSGTALVVQVDSWQQLPRSRYGVAQLGMALLHLWCEVQSQARTNSAESCQVVREAFQPFCDVLDVLERQSVGKNLGDARVYAFVQVGEHVLYLLSTGRLKELEGAKDDSGKKAKEAYSEILLHDPWGVRLGGETTAPGLLWEKWLEIRTDRAKSLVIGEFRPNASVLNQNQELQKFFNYERRALGLREVNFNGNGQDIPGYFLAMVLGDLFTLAGKAEGEGRRDLPSGLVSVWLVSTVVPCDEYKPFFGNLVVVHRDSLLLGLRSCLEMWVQEMETRYQSAQSLTGMQPDWARWVRNREAKFGKPILLWWEKNARSQIRDLLRQDAFKGDTEEFTIEMKLSFDLGLEVSPMTTSVKVEHGEMTQPGEQEGSARARLVLLHLAEKHGYRFGSGVDFSSAVCKCGCSSWQRLKKDVNENLLLRRKDPLRHVLGERCKPFIHRLERDGKVYEEVNLIGPQYFNLGMVAATGGEAPGGESGMQNRQSSSRTPGRGRSRSQAAGGG